MPMADSVSIDALIGEHVMFGIKVLTATAAASCNIIKFKLNRAEIMTPSCPF